ncbi:hypothetical protein D1013_06815 [Euzebyella marina]|uniref:Uncharacterized protein n=1 Tax=Euzebyella marina TaxID=1761453 RepID=A0A3G2L4D6_9FLAO|nr:hypothetical protein [Euzebyella marina]AYN67099.1 hypothetical protein D1013_06815 [Euzebyella marina]
MKKHLITGLAIIYTFFNYSCEQAKDLKDSFDAIDCAELLIELDEEYDRGDKSCEETKKDIDQLLKKCREFLTEENIADLEFIRANCSDDD